MKFSNPPTNEQLDAQQRAFTKWNAMSAQDRNVWGCNWYLYLEDYEEQTTEEDDGE